MPDRIEEVRKFYNSSPWQEWERLARHPVEFTINTSYLDRYIQPGERVLDCGGGPGRYSLYLAKKGCDVTLVDLSEENITFARRQFDEEGVKVKALAGDARQIAETAPGEYDHVLLMGPLYHLLEEKDRIQATAGCLSLLKPGGNLYAAFITTYAGMIYALREYPELLLTEDSSFLLNDTSFAGPAFTQAYFARIGEVVPFFEQFPLEKLHLLGSESVLAPFEHQVMSQPKKILQGCIEFAKQICEREEVLPYSEHLLYIGRKRGTALL